MRWPDAPSPPPSLLSVNVVIQHVNVRYVRYVLYVMYNAVSRVSCMPRLFLTFPCQRKFKIAYLESVWLSKRRPCIRFCRIRSTLLDETSVGMCKVLRGGMPVDVLESLVTNRLTEIPHSSLLWNPFVSSRFPLYDLPFLFGICMHRGGLDSVWPGLSDTHSAMHRVSSST